MNIWIIQVNFYYCTLLCTDLEIFFVQFMKNNPNMPNILMISLNFPKMILIFLDNYFLFFAKQYIPFIDYAINFLHVIVLHFLQIVIF